MIKELEIQRIDSVKNSINDFLSLHNKIFKQNTEEILMILNETPNDTMDITAVLSDEETNILKNEFGEGHLFEVLIHWALPSPPRSNLVVKSGNIDRETGVFKV